MWSFWTKNQCICRMAVSFNDDDWQVVTTADVEDNGKYYKCVILEHKTGGGCCIFLGNEEYEGIGDQHKCDTYKLYTYANGVLRDTDGDIIPAHNIKEGPLPSDDFAPDLESEISDENKEDEYVSLRSSRGARGRGSGRGDRGRGRGRGTWWTRTRSWS